MLNAIKQFGTSKAKAQEGEPIMESTPLLEDEEAQAMNKEEYDSVVDDEEESAAVPIMGDSSHLGTIAPPPAAAPPPPPSNDPQSTDDKNNKDRKRNSSSSNNSLSGLSTTQSIKSGKSSSTRRRKKKNTNTNNKSIKKKKPDGPQKSMCHLLFDSVRYLAIIASSMMLLMQLVPLYILKSESTWLQIAVRSYLAIFCLFFILTESNIPILRDLLSKFAHSNWILRGFLYSFIGLIGIEQNLAIKVADIAAGTTSSVLGPTYEKLFESLFMDITTWTMISVGILYFVLGLLCMQQWYEKLTKNHNQKVREYKQKKKREADFKKQQEEYKKYERDRSEGRGEWYDDIE